MDAYNITKKGNPWLCYWPRTGLDVAAGWYSSLRLITVSGCL